jgi:hypothetical protein
MKNIVFFVFSIIMGSLLKAQTVPIVGSNLVNQTCFVTKTPAAGYGANQEFPKLVKQDTTYAVSWVQSGSPIKVLKVELDTITSNLRTAISGTGNVITNVGALNSSSTVDQTFAVLPNGLRLQVYVRAQNNQYALMGNVYYKNVLVSNDFRIEGLFTTANARPRYPQITTDGISKFFVVYHSSSGTASPSVIRMKVIDVSNVVVPIVSAPAVIINPAPSNVSQNGFVISDPSENDALFPKVVYSRVNNELGIVYQTGSANSSVVRFATVDTNGVVKHAAVNVNDLGYQADFPAIALDGNDYAIIWRDFRSLNVAGQNLTGTPAIRFCKMTSNCTPVNLTNTNSEIYSVTDKSLLVSNPYQFEASMYSDLTVKQAGQKYGVTWATQSAPYEVQFSEVLITGSNVSASIFTKVHSDTENNDRPSIATVNNKYVIAYSSYVPSPGGYFTKLAIENRIDTTLSVLLDQGNTYLTTSQEEGDYLPSLYTYQWYDCNAQSTSGLPDQFTAYTVSSSGIYAVIISNSSCVDTSQCVSVNLVGINEVRLNEKLNLYPNPSDGKFRIETDLNYSSIIIKNNLGQIVMQFNIISTDVIDLSNLSVGVYFVAFETKEGTIIKKIIKNK